MHEDHIHSLKQLKQCVSLKQLINALTTIIHISHTLVLELIAMLEHNHVNTHNIFCHRASIPALLISIRKNIA